MSDRRGPSSWRWRGAVLVAAAALLVGCARQTETVTPATAPPDTAATPATTRPGTTVRGTTTPRRTTPDVDLGGIDPAVFDDLPDGGSYRGWKTVTDVTDSVRVDVPEEWESDGQERVIEGNDVPTIYASADQEAYDANRSVAGLRIFRYPSALSAKGIEWALDRQAERDSLAECTAAPEDHTFEDQGWSGRAVVATGCGEDNRMAIVHIAATDLPGVGDLAVLQVQLVRQRDVEALARVVRTFQVARDEPTTTTSAPTTTTSAPPTTRSDLPDYSLALQLVKDHVRSCGMDYDWTSADGGSDGGGALWNVTIWIIPGPGGGGPGAADYRVDVDTGSVTSTNGTANVLCPG
ncbi:MAG: hypothetical protein R2726_07545 [Acidimicrobiales bacterium]